MAGGAVEDATWAAAVACAERLPAGAPPLILGSQSASRRAILAATGAVFDCESPDIDERSVGDRAGQAEPLVRAIAEAKAEALLARLAPGSGRVLLTGDQVVAFRGEIREKPRDLAQAREFLASYAATPVDFVGALCLHDIGTGRRVVAVHAAHVHFAPTIAEVEADEAMLACAGGIMVEHPRVAPHVKHVEGGMDSVMGLSTKLLCELLQQLQSSDASCSQFGTVLGRRGLRSWAVVGDCLNEAKPAFRVVQRLELAGRRVFKVSPYDSTGACYKTVEDIPEQIDAINLIISPKIGLTVLDSMHKLGIRHVFMQPGADAADVVRRADELGLVVQRGCVLVSETPPLD